MNMKKGLVCLIGLILPMVLLSQATKKALIIGIDGCRPDALEVASTPNIDELITTGIFSPDALNDDITISGPGWSSILCGVWSEKHLVTGNGFSVDDYESYPSFFKRAKEFNPALQTLSICHWGPINDNIIGDQVDFSLNVSSDEAVAEKASAYLSVNDPDIVFLHFDEADGVGHGSGFSPDVPEYLSIIEEIDSLVGVVIEAIENRPDYEDEEWLILLTTDHGGLGTSHGGNSIEEERVFVIASGNALIPEVILRDSVVTSNDEINCLGETIELQFDGENDGVAIPDNPNLNFGSTQDFSIECRVKTPSAGDVAIVGNKDWQTGFNKGFVFSFKLPSGPEWKVNIGDGNQRADINTGGSIADNKWYTLSVTFDRDGYMKMYQDGLLLDSTDISFIGDINTDSGLFLGSDINSAFNYNGAISEVRVWNTVLESENILQWHCSDIDDSHPQYSELTGYWKLNEGAGNTIVNDNSLNNNNGNIIEATWEEVDSLVITYDYSNTPRITDIAPTVLDHLCIPVEDNWNLDGVSLIPDCSITSLEKVSTNYKIKIYPNPAKDEILVELNTKDDIENLSLELYSSSGTKMLESTIHSSQMKLDVSHFVSGVYFLRFIENGNIILAEKMFIQ